MMKLWKSDGEYSIEKERVYYSRSACDRTEAPYRHLTKYFAGSVGVDVFEGKDVLDMGCGEGVYTAWIADEGKAGRVIGFDLTEHRLRTDYETRLRNLHFVCGDIFNPQLDGGRFDVVFMNLVLHHLRFNLPGAVKSIASCLKNGGTFLAFEPNVYSPLAVLLHQYHDRSENEGLVSPPSLKKAFQSEGFENISFGFFWRDRRWARNRLLATNFWFRAQKAARGKAE